ncbi:cytochrome C [Actibacterium mucosum KCTC 23349]|uniref:Cytochrome C n=1 Tax=Actibacterium mucosum KCTC 23349 TaxID=1454373 RepID=A0A037ZHB5_9RHOB|nr:cytochrome c family protein [Actibacterium mucosum]KAJ54897.1 cytochrome C [Actibacterium mucosum KCTC 23349]
MFDTMTLTKVVGGLCGALLIFLLGGWAAETIYHTGGGHGAHGDEHASTGYVIQVAEAHGEEEEVEVISFAEYFAAADATKGEKVFGKCKSCHALEEGKQGTGPTLYNIVDRAVAAEDFGYSGKLIAVVDVWTPEALDGFLTSPKKYAPGTKMSFNGLAKPEDRANLIAYLQTIGG